MDDENKRNFIWRHIAQIGTCMMVTYDGGIRARPMRGLARREQNAIWFFTEQETGKDEESQQDSCACLAYADIEAQTYLSVSGRIAWIRDQATIAALWHEGAALYFPQGPDDPRLVLLRFTPETGEYWDAPSSAIVLAIKFLESKITGERPNLGANETVDFL